MTENRIGITEAGFRARRGKERLMLAVLIALGLTAACFLLVWGDQVYSIGTVLRVLFGADIKGATYAVNTIRVPRVLVGALAGFAFGVAGNTFQKILRNSLASPDVMGVTSGASAVEIFAMMVLGLSGVVVSVLAVAGGVAVALLILMISQRGSFSVNKLILTGIGMQAMLQAVINFIILKTSDYNVSDGLRWLSGSLNGVRMKDVPVFAVVVVVTTAIILLLSRDIQILGLGEELPITLGMRPKLMRLMLVLSSVVLCAVATAVTGPLASVAFMAGPISARLLKTGGTNTLHAGLVGVIIVLVSEALGQFAFSTRFPVGVITGIIGAPYLIYLLLGMNRRSA
ncbi:MAG: iron ABC transporter permease [Clostridia bacterium]|nr:iron ABC transporter permease [Clostridia bacterium]